MCVPKKISISIDVFSPPVFPGYDSTKCLFLMGYR